MQFNLQRLVRYNFLRFKRLRGNPRSLAIATATGVFIGLTPTIPLHTVIILLTTLLFRIPPVAAIIGSTIVSNPLTFIPQYYLAWRIGNLILPNRLDWSNVVEVLEILRAQGLIQGVKTLSTLSLDFILVMLSGGGLLALPFALASYALSLKFFIKIREKQREKHFLR